jgi:predicted nuclease of restriction endonuclease-like RecB superfamily
VLTPELVRARKKAGELVLTPLSPKQRTAALELSAALIGVAAEHRGRTREELTRALGEACAPLSDKKLAQGLTKLVEDECEFSAPDIADSAELRSRIFLRASAARAALGPLESFDRSSLLAEIAGEVGAAADQLDAALYSDLRGSHLLLSVPNSTPEHLVMRYETAQRQAVLLRAVKVVADVRGASVFDYRALFHKLKFRRLLYELWPLPGGGYRIEIDGPFSLFESVTKYGLSLALTLPALEACGDLSLSADLRWGKAREGLKFRFDSPRASAAGSEPPRASDEVAGLVRGLTQLETPWKARLCQSILDSKGAGLCVPDLEFEHAETGEIAYLEVLGYWSRDAVWRRIELVERGLGERILFAVSSRLRVSEAALDDQELGALYVYKGTMSPRAVASRLDDLKKRRLTKQKR